MPQRTKGKLPYLELVWLPHYLVTFEAVAGERAQTVRVVVGAHEPTATVIDLSAAEWDEPQDREHFSPSVTEEEAQRAARDALLQVLLRAPGWGRKPSVSETSQIELAHYPFWTYYFARRRRILDVKLLDAVTGQPTGAKAKIALLAALADAERSR